MKKLICLFLIFQLCVLSFAHQEDSPTNKRRREGIVVRKSDSDSCPIRHVPANVELVVFLEDEAVKILFLTNFGAGEYCINCNSDSYYDTISWVIKHNDNEE